MSSTTTRTSKTRTIAGATGAVRSLRTVPDRDTVAKVRTDAGDRLEKALRANPNSTVTDLARAAEIGKSTAAKILSKWHKGGSVTRTPGIGEGGRRAAELWAINAAGTGADADPTECSSVADADSVGSGQTDVTAAEPTAPQSTLSVSAEGGPTDIAGDNTSGATNTGGTEAAATELAGSVVTEPANPAAQPVVDNAAPGSDTTPDGVNRDNADKDGGTVKVARLAPCALRGMVEDHLRDHPGEEFGPVVIAKALGGKSSGAVSNALDKLVAAGTAVKTKERPRRFALAPTEQAAASAAAK